MKERKSKKALVEQQQQQNGHAAHAIPFNLAKLVDREASWDKDELCDVLHWIRQAVGLMCGLLWGAIPIVGAIWIVVISKPSNRKTGLYMPLPVPARPWESVSMDFLGGLPTTRRGHNYLLLVVDRFSKMIILIPCKNTVTGVETARLYFIHVWTHFGLPSSIVSDRDSRFLGAFWRTLWTLMDTRLQKSTPYHPQTDGQTEVVNRTMVHLLRGYNAAHPKTWDDSLPYLQFAFNRAIHESTGRSPFESFLGYVPSSPFDLEFTLTTSPSTHGEENAATKARRFVEHIAKVHQEVEQQLNRAQQRYKARHDRHRVAGKYNEGDLVWLHLGKERLRGAASKLRPLRYGPFKIIRMIGDNACQLELPEYMSIYSVVNINDLKPFEPSLLDDETHEVLPAIDELVMDKDTVLSDDTILEKKCVGTRRGQRISYRVGRKGQSPRAAKWYTVELGRLEFPHLHF